MLKHLHFSFFLRKECNTSQDRTCFLPFQTVLQRLDTSICSRWWSSYTGYHLCSVSCLSPASWCMWSSKDRAQIILPTLPRWFLDNLAMSTCSPPLGLYDIPRTYQLQRWSVLVPLYSDTLSSSQFLNNYKSNLHQNCIILSRHKAEYGNIDYLLDI